MGNIDAERALKEIFGDQIQDEESPYLDIEGAYDKIFGVQKTEETDCPQKIIQEDNVVVGLDVGTTKVVCIVGKKTNEGKIRILGYGECASEGMKRGVITNMADTIEAVRTAVEQASKRSGMGIHRVSIGIAGQRIKILQHRGVLMRDNHETEITESELERLRNDTFKINMMPGEEIIDVIRQDTYVDGELASNPVGMLGNKIEANFYVIIGQTSAAKNFINCIQSAGLEMEYMIPEPIASAQAVLDEKEKDVGAALIDIGGGTTDFAIFKNKKIQHTAVIPFGGNIITEDICSGCSIIKQYAEEVKVKFGSAIVSENSDDEVVSIPGIHGRAPKEISYRSIARIIQARLEEIFELVNYEIQKTKSENQLIAGIVLTGGGALMKHIQQLAEFKTGLEVRIGYPNEQIVQTGNDYTNPKYATSIGLVIEGFNRKELEGKKKQDLKEEICSDNYDKQNNTKEIDATKAITEQNPNESSRISTDSKLKGWFKKIVRK